MASEKKLTKVLLSKVWKKMFELLKMLIGDVDVVNKGTLQDQIDKKGIVEMSLADYMALSDEEKNDDTIRDITDAVLVSDDGIALKVVDDTLVVVYNDMNIAIISDSYTFSDVDEIVFNEKYDVIVGEAIYAKWDNMEYSGTDSVADCVGIEIVGYDANDNQLCAVTEYQSYANEVELVDATTGNSFSTFTDLSYIEVLLRSSETSDATFPVTMSLDNFKIYYKEVS